MVRKKETRILIADGNRARVLVNDGPGKGLHAASQVELSRQLPPSRELDTDRPGQVQEGGYSGGMQRT